MEAVTWHKGTLENSGRGEIFVVCRDITDHLGHYEKERIKWVWFLCAPPAHYMEKKKKKKKEMWNIEVLRLQHKPDKSAKCSRNLSHSCDQFIVYVSNPANGDRLVGLVVKASASRAEGPVFESRLRRDFFGVESYQWLQNWHSSGYPARRLAL